VVAKEIDTRRKCQKMQRDSSPMLERGTAGRRARFSLLTPTSLLWIVARAGASRV